jgi:DNA replication protein DnaC
VDALLKYKKMAEEKLRSLETKSGESEPKNYKCPICRDQQYIAVLDDGRELPLTHPDLVGKLYSGKECECLKRERTEKLFRSSHITDAFQRLGFRTFNVEGRPQCVKDAKDAALEYFNEFEHIRHNRQNSLALLGEPGCGKTHLLMAVANNLMRRGTSVLYWPYVEGMNELKAKLEGLEERIHRMKHVEVLFIDDLFKGRSKPTEFGLEQMFGVINYRYLNHLPILLSSERGFNEICEIDMGLGSRLYEMCKAYTVIMGLTEAEQKQGMVLNYRLR